MKAERNHKFKEIYDTESDAIFRFCLVRVSNRDQALDIMQETFLRLWQNMLADKEILNHRAFLFTVAHHLIIDWYRKKKSISLDSMTNKEDGFDPEDEMTTVGNLQLKAEGRYLLEMIQKLSPTYKQAVYLRFVEDLSPPQIAEILSVSENAASVRINRGLEELRKIAGYNNQ
jgi:RNA polymerase sigma-70 factor (ECF subfamily)